MVSYATWIKNPIKAAAQEAGKLLVEIRDLEAFDPDSPELVQLNIQYVSHLNMISKFAVAQAEERANPQVRFVK